MTLDGDALKHVFVMGSDSYGRDIYSRVLYGTRVSLAVGLRRGARRAGLRHRRRARRRLHPLARTACSCA